MLRAYTVTEAGRALGMTSAEVHKAIEHGLLWAFTIDEATRVPAEEVDRVKANAARRQRLEVEAQRRAAEDWRRRPKIKDARAWTFERQAPRSNSRS